MSIENILKEYIEFDIEPNCQKPLFLDVMHTLDLCL